MKERFTNTHTHARYTTHTHAHTIHTLWTIKTLTCKLFHLNPQVTLQQGQEFADKVDAIFFETSSLTGKNIDELFMQLGKSIQCALDVAMNKTLKKVIYYYYSVM